MSQCKCGEGSGNDPYAVQEEGHKASGVTCGPDQMSKEGDHLGGELRVERKREDHANNWSPGALLKSKDRKGTQSRETEEGTARE